MSRVLIILLLILLLGLSTSFAENDEISLRATDSVVAIGLGESVRLEIKEGSKIHVSDGTVVRSRVMGRTVIMTGRKTGRTTLRAVGGNQVGDKTIVVTERKIATTVRLFQKHIAAGRGLRMNLDALPVISVTGELLRLEDWSALVTLARETKNPWRLEASVFPSVRPLLAMKIESELRKIAWPGQKFSMDEKGLRLTGGSESASLTADLKLAATTMGIRLETSAGLTELEPMIRTQIVIAEVRRSRTTAFGVQFPEFAAATLAPSLQLSTDALLVKIHAMESEGDGRILAMPTLLCRSGGEAKFLAGGEIPIKLQSLRASQVEWKKYGITLHVQPQADRLKRMKFQLTTEISTLDKANAVEQVPGLLTNRIETQFNLNGPQTIVLSGLIKREEGQSADGIPLLRSIPILGSLFGSQDFRKALTELIIFVSPEVVIPDAAGSYDHE